MKNKLTLEEFVTSQSLVSRRALLEFIKQDAVTVNGAVVQNLLHEIVVKTDVVVVDKSPVEWRYDYMYFRFYKPSGMLSTMEDPKGRLCIGDFVKQMGVPVFPVGRLDRQTSGLMVLTNDGSFSQLLMHPSYEVKKTYSVGLDKKLVFQDLERLQKGVMLEDGPITFSSVSEVASRQVHVSTHSGRNRLVRRAFEHLGHKVASLKRLRLGSISLEGISKGEAVIIPKKLIKEIKNEISNSCVDIIE